MCVAKIFLLSKNRAYSSCMLLIIGRYHYTVELFCNDVFCVLRTVIEEKFRQFLLLFREHDKNKILNCPLAEAFNDVFTNRLRIERSWICWDWVSIVPTLHNPVLFGFMRLPSTKLGCCHYSSDNWSRCVAS